MQTAEAVTCVVSADELGNKSSLSLETVHTQPCLPNAYCCMAMQCVRLETSLLACASQQSLVEQH